MKELLEKLKENNCLDALESEEALQKAAAELGYTKEQIDTMLSELDGFPIDDDRLGMISGGFDMSDALSGGFEDTNPYFN